MKLEYLIKIVEDLLNESSTNFNYKIYDSLKMDNEELDVEKINGIARISAGSFDPIKDLGQSSVTVSIEFIYPYERLEAVNETCENVSKQSAGLVVVNSVLDENLVGTTGVSITYPIQGNYFNGTMGETAKSRLVCYFDINEKSVLSNEVTIDILNGYTQATNVTAETEGVFYTLSNGIYTRVILPGAYVSGTTYYVANWQNIPYYKYVITRHRLSTTNKYENNSEMQTINDGQSIDFSLAVPSIRNSVMNTIKNDMLLGLNEEMAFNFRFNDEGGYKYFDNMIPSGDFSYEVVPGDLIIFKILFVYKRED